MERQSSVMKLRHGGAVGDRDHGESRQPLLEPGVERLLRCLVHGRPLPFRCRDLAKKRQLRDRRRSQCDDGKTRHVPTSMIFPLAFPLVLGLFLLLLAILVLVVELRILGYAYRKIGVPARYMFVVMLLSLLGSHVNIPLYAMPVERLLPAQDVTVLGRAYLAPPLQKDGVTIIAINVGGALLPLILSLYLFLRSSVRWRMVLGIAVVAAIVHSLAQIVPGVGIAVPMIVPPLAAAVVSLVLAFRRAPPVAYVSGSMGALIGADLSNLQRIGELGAPVVSIGGAGTFDGVFISGVIAVLLA